MRRTGGLVLVGSLTARPGMRMGACVVLFFTVAIPGCRPNVPQQVRLERRWSPGVYLCEARDQTDLDTAMRAYGGGRRRGTRITTTEVADLIVGEADSSGTKRLEWRPRRMAVVRNGAVCDSESEAATSTCFVPRAMVQTAFTGHVNPDGTASEDGIGPADCNVAKMWSAFRSWMSDGAEWERMMGDLRRVLAVNFGPLNHLPPVVSAGDTWSSSSSFSAPSFPGGLEIGYQHKVERIDDAPGGQTVTIVSTSTGGAAGRNVALGEFGGRVMNAAHRSTRVFDVSLGMVTNKNDLASGELDLDFGPGVTGTLTYRYESSTTCRKAGK